MGQLLKNKQLYLIFINIGYYNRISNEGLGYMNKLKGTGFKKTHCLKLFVSNNILKTIRKRV